MKTTLDLDSAQQQALLQCAFLSPLSDAARDAVMRTMTVRRYQTQDIVFREGTTADTFCCVLSGLVRLYRVNIDGREADLGIFSAGDVFGECSMFLENCYPADAKVAEKAVLAHFDTAMVFELLPKFSDIAQAISGILAHHLKAAQNCIADDRLKTAPQRVASFLLARCPPGSPSSTFRLPYQKSLLAGTLGLAPEALSRAFSQLRQNGVSIMGRNIAIEDTDALRQFSRSE